MTATLLVIAKAPIAGFAKTRLTPTLTPAQAADVAAAALLDTLESVLRSGVRSRVVALTGDLERAAGARDLARLVAEFEVISQRGNTFGERLANAHADAARYGHPVLQIGMDTPQVRPELLALAARRLSATGDALLGPATDGGWWALGLPAPQSARLLVDVPMSTDRTGMLTRQALLRCGYRVRELPTLTDVDRVADAVAVAAECSGRFAKLIDELHLREPAAR